MHILPELGASRNNDANVNRSAGNASHGSSPTVSAAAAKQTPSSGSATPESATVTLSKDSDGRFFYKVTNSQTGELILEFPPEAVRTVGKGIEEYVRQHARKKLEAKV